MRVTVLGCGSSGGVPLIGCDCPVCTSKNPKNTRTRVSLYIETKGQHLLVDTSPDLRQQALRHNIRQVDAVLYTHDHADHTHGIDELRSYNYLSKESLPVYGNKVTLETIQSRFSYVFMEKPKLVWVRPSVIAKTLPDEPVHTFSIGDVQITAFEQHHGKSKTLGYRIGDFAYSTDTDELPDSAFDILHGVKVWVVDCLRYTASYSHSYLERTLGWIERVHPTRAILTHMGHEIDYDTISSQLPGGVAPAYDGMVIEL